MAKRSSLTSRLAAHRAQTYRTPPERRLHSLNDAVDFIEASGLVDHYRKEKEGADRVENLEELVNAAAAFVSEEGLAAYEADAANAPTEIGRAHV